jgi:hypothetical protein
MDTSVVHEQVKAAFPDQPLPDMTLRQAQLADQSMSREISEEEWQSEGRQDRHVKWTEIEAATLLQCNAALSHLDENAFAYYLPAYLLFALNCLGRPRYSHDLLFTFVVHAVTDVSNYNLARLKRLTDSQIDAVISFLRLVRTLPNIGSEPDVCAELASTALQRYWETPDARRRTLIYVP